MNNNYYADKEMRIDISELCWRLISQWKAILLVVVLAASIICGLKYYKTKAIIVPDTNNDVEVLDSVDAQVESILEGLSSLDRNKIETVVHQREWINQQRDYVSNSLLLSMDPKNLKALKLIYYIEDEETYRKPLCDAYLELLEASDIAESVKKAMNLDVENRYISELIYTSKNQVYSSNETISVYVALPEGVDPEAVKEAINNAVYSYNKDFSGKIHPHKIVNVSAFTTALANDTASRYYTDTINNVNNLRAALAGAENDLNDFQKGVYNKIVALKESTVDIKADENNAPVKVRVSKKYIVLGAFVGFLLYVLLYLLYLVYRNRVYSEKSLTPYKKESVIGSVYYKKEHKGFSKILHSRLIDGVRYKKMTGTDQNKRISSSILARCMNKAVDTISIISLSNLSTACRQTVDDIISELNNNGIRTDEIVLEDSSTFNESVLSSANPSICVVEGNATRRDALEYSYEVQQIYGIDNLGVVYVQEY